MLGVLRRLLSSSIPANGERGREEEAHGLPPVIVASDPSLVRVNAVPRSELPRIWSIASNDAALSFLDPQEYYIALLKGEIIAELAHLYLPDPEHPRIREMLARDVKEWLDMENAKLYALFRMARNKHGFERRMLTMTAPRWAVTGW